MQQDPHCYWCKVEVVYYKLSEVPKKGLPANFATIDHLFDKWEGDKRREAWKQMRSQTVLACHSCNHRRNEERMKEISVSAQIVRNQLAVERKKLGSTQPRDQVFRNLETLSNWDHQKHTKKQGFTFMDVAKSKE